MPFNPIPVAQRLAQLCRAELITPHVYRVGMALLWECRAPNHDEVQVSYRRLAELAGVGLTKTKQAVARLRELGVLTWHKTRLRIAWGAGIASRQWRNIYRFLKPATEVTARPTDSRQEKKQKGFEERRSGRIVRNALRKLGQALRGGSEQSAEEMDREARENAKRQVAILLAG